MTPIPVPGVECPCPGKPHPEGDIVELRDRLGLAAGTTLQSLTLQSRASGEDAAQVTGRLVESYLLVGVCGWTFTDENGKPVPVTEDNIRSLLLEDFGLAYPIAEKADELYHEAVLGPLVNGPSKSSPATSTGVSTSASKNGSRKRPRPSRPSSTTTSQTGVTVTTSV